MMIVLVILVGVAFAGYKMEEYQTQKAWEEKVAHVIATEYQLGDLMLGQSTSPLWAKALSQQLSAMSDMELRCLIDSFIRDGYPGDLEDGYREYSEITKARLAIGPYIMPPYRYYSERDLDEENMRGIFDQEAAIGKILLKDILERQTKAGKDQVIHSFARSMKNGDFWSLERGSHLVMELFNLEELSDEETATIVREYTDSFLDTFDDFEVNFFVKKGLPQILDKKSYELDKKKILGNINRTPTEDLFSFLDKNHSNSSDGAFMKEIVEVLKDRQLSDQQILDLYNLEESS